MASSNFLIQFVLPVTDSLLQCLTHFMVLLHNLTEIYENGVFLLLLLLEFLNFILFYFFLNFIFYTAGSY